MPIKLCCTKKSTVAPEYLQSHSSASDDHGAASGASPNPKVQGKPYDATSEAQMRSDALMRESHALVTRAQKALPDPILTKQLDRLAELIATYRTNYKLYQTLTTLQKHAKKALPTNSLEDRADIHRFATWLSPLSVTKLEMKIMERVEYLFKNTAFRPQKRKPFFQRISSCFGGSNHIKQPSETDKQRFKGLLEQFRAAPPEKLSTDDVAALKQRFPDSIYLVTLSSSSTFARYSDKDIQSRHQDCLRTVHNLLKSQSLPSNPTLEEKKTFLENIAFILDVRPKPDSQKTTSPREFLDNLERQSLSNEDINSIYSRVTLNLRWLALDQEFNLKLSQGAFTIY